MSESFNFLEVLATFDAKASEETEGAIKIRIREQGCVHAIGKNEVTKALIGAGLVDAVIDDYSTAGMTWQGVPLVPGNNLSDRAVVVNCSFSISPLTVQRKFERLYSGQVIPYCELLRHGLMLPPPEFVVEAGKSFKKYSHEFGKVEQMLADDISVQTYQKLMSFRLTSDLQFMEDFTIRFRDQYFEPFLGDLKDVTFVDCGGFDGDTTEEFVRRYPAYKRVKLFEPSSKNIGAARKRLENIRDIEYIAQGVSDEAGQLKFNAEAGSASSVTQDGDVTIAVTTLDSCLADDRYFIKMDLEGWEIKALQGCRRVIEKCRPILAIAVYHHIDDFWKIPELVMDMESRYSIYLRHYTEGWSETVMYFVPQE